MSSRRFTYGFSEDGFNAVGVTASQRFTGVNVALMASLNDQATRDRFNPLELRVKASHAYLCVPEFVIREGKYRFPRIA